MKFSIFEVIMLVCFGLSWPFSIIKTIRLKNPTGKSYLFMGLIIIGYVAGCLHKILYHWDWVFYLYLLLGTLVVTDFMLCVYYMRKRRSTHFLAAEQRSETRKCRSLNQHQVYNVL